MPNTFIENRDAWIRMADIDYVGQFVKAWLAFNAWYPSAYTESRDRKIINEIKWQPNPVLSKLRPMLEVDSEEAEQFRSEIGLLHNRLDGYELHGGIGDHKKRITLCDVFLRENPPIVVAHTLRGYKFQIERQANKHVRVNVEHDKKARVVLQHSQSAFDLANLEAQPAFGQLTLSQKGFLRQLYCQAAPHWFENLTTYKDQDANTREIECGAYSFNCGKDALFAGVVEVVYQMRCTLFHGELAPTKKAVACYEPAFRLVRLFLECVA